MTSVEWGIPDIIMQEEALAVSDAVFEKLKTHGSSKDQTSASRHAYIEELRKTADVKQIVGQILFGSGDSRNIEIKAIGKGGFASVYSVYDAESGKSTAVKIVSFRLSSFVNFEGDFILSSEDYEDSLKTDIVKKQLKVFTREAEIIHSKSGIRGIPSTGGKQSFVVKLYYDEGEKRNLFDFVLFIPMERYERIITDSPWDEQEALKLAEDVLICLKNVHSQYIHRDIKPANILKKPEGGYVIIDWGGAKKTGEADTHIEDLNRKGEALNGADGKAVPRIPRSKGYSDPARVTVNSEGVAEFNHDYEKKPAVDLYSLGIVMALLVYNRGEGSVSDSKEERYKNSESRMSGFINNGDFFETNEKFYDGLCVREELFDELNCSTGYKAIIKKAIARKPGEACYTTAEQMLRDVQSLSQPGINPTDKKKNESIKLTSGISFVAALITYLTAFLVSSAGSGKGALTPFSEVITAVFTVIVFFGMAVIFKGKYDVVKKDIISAFVLWIINILISFVAGTGAGVSIPTPVTVISAVIISPVCIIFGNTIRNLKIQLRPLIKNIICWAVYGAVSGICLGVTVCMIPALSAEKMSMFMNSASFSVIGMCAIFAAVAGSAAGIIISMFETAYKTEK